VGVPLHTDAVQAVGQLPVDFAASGVDALTMTGHKLGGPMGAGALLLRRDAECTPLLHGGGQERDVRSGTLDVAAIVGLAVATVTSVGERGERTARLAALRDRLVAGIVEQVPDAELNGPALDDVVAGGPGRLPANAHLSFPGAEGDALLMLLDARGIECSTGSACSAGVARPSHVLLAAGADADRARSSLRFSLGRTSTEADVDAVLEVIAPVVERARRAGTGRR
jgi:cysteine desulfurase